MPITQSAKKALRQSLSRRRGNLARAKAMKTAIKALEKSPGVELLAKAYQAVDKAIKARVIHSNRGARLKSQLSKLPKNKR